MMKKYLLCFTIASLLAPCAMGAGFQLSEYTVTGLGRSFAGLGVTGDDFSALAFNPAGMQYNQTSGAQAGATVVSLHFDYKGETDTAATVGENGIPTPGAQSGRGHSRPTRVLPHLFAQQKLNDKTTLGLGVYVPFGLATDYPNNWFAQSQAGLSQLEAVDVSPALSYAVNDWFSVGAAMNIQYIKAHFTSKLEKSGLYFDSSKSNMEGDDYAAGYTVGFTVTPRKDIRLGVAYRSKISHELTGDLKITGMPQTTITPQGPLSTGGYNGKSNIKAKVTTPETVLFTGAYDIADFTFSGTARYTRWSRFKTLDIYNKSTGALVSSTDEKWKNTWYFGGGVDYRLNQAWTIRAGLGYDQTTIRAPEYRTPRVPDGRRVLTSFGAGWQMDQWQIDAGYMHIFMHGGEATGGTKGSAPYRIKYTNDADLFSLGVQYKF